MTKLSALITTLVLGSSSVAMAQHDDGFAYRGDRFLGERDTTYGVREDDGHARRALRDRDLRFDDRHDRGQDRHGHRHGHHRDDLGPRRYRARWVALGGAQLGRGDGRDRIAIHERGTFTQLRIQAGAGRAYLDRVVVRFADGSRQVVPVGRTLDARQRFVEFELDGNNRRVDSVILLGDARRGGGLEVWGI